MFEFGFSEMLLTAVVALVVLGPERLPKVARGAGQLLGKIQYFVNNVKSEFNRQVDAGELRDVKESFQSAARDMRESLNGLKQGLDTQVQSLSDGLGPDLPAWERLPEQRTPADFGVDENGQPLSPVYTPPAYHGVHTVSLRRQAMARKRDMRPRFRAKPALRGRRKR